MSKPYGMTAAFQIVRPTREEDKVWDAVEAAVDAGWTVERFRQEAAECWHEYMREKATNDARAWKNL